MNLLSGKQLIRKAFLSFLLFAGISTAAFSQCGTQWVDSGFVYPFTYLYPCIYQTDGFSSSFQVNMPNMFHGILELDSIFIDSITGLPSGITWSSSPYPLVLDGDSSGCITLYGTTTADTGVYNLNFFCHAVVTSQGSAGTQDLSYNQLLSVGDAPIPVFSVHVLAPGDSCEPLDSLIELETGVGDISDAPGVAVYPNPIHSGAWQIYTSDAAIGSQAEVFDAAGNLVVATTVRRSNFGIYAQNFAPGVYLLRLHNSSYSVVKRLIKI